MGKMVTYIVKDGPISNDATMEDTVQVGMDRAARVITTGLNHLGAPLQKVSAEAGRLLKEAGLIK